MPRYFFDVTNGHRLFDATGFVCDDDFAALIKASVLAIGVSLDKPKDDPDRRVAVINNQGREIGNVPVYPTPSYKNRAIKINGPKLRPFRKTQPYSKRFAHRGIWVEPSLLAEIEYRAKSAEGKVRHPSMRAARGFVVAVELYPGDCKITARA